MKQHWIRSAPFDLAWILAPGLLPVFMVVLFPDFFSEQSTDISITWWVVLVLLVDVAHVYSTVFRTYLNRKKRMQHSLLFRVTPGLCLLFGIIFYSLHAHYFWTALAYLAVFHFIRQQYGFLRIYSSKERLSTNINSIFTFTIYAFTVVPILIWHAEGPKNFNWFIENDFLYFNSPVTGVALRVGLAATTVLYVFTEIFVFYRYCKFNLPRFLLMAGTGLSWYIGIVAYNGDLVFTMLNVISHGIPYMALIWATEKTTNESDQPQIFRLLFRNYGVILFVGLLAAAAYLEEGLWDSFVWRERPALFNIFYGQSPVTTHNMLAFLVPLLALPQMVHYVLDGFIWKKKNDELPDVT